MDLTKKIIFDLDDTLYKEGELRERREKAIHNFLGEKTKDYLELRKSRGTLVSLEALGVSRQQFFKLMEEVPINLKKNEDLVLLLKNLKTQYKLFVLSNSPKKCVFETLKQLGILDLIEEYYGGDDFKNNKPSEENFFMVQAGDICVGNRFDKDLAVPKKKGAITVFISETPNEEAHFNIKSIYDLGQLKL